MLGVHRAIWFNVVQYGAIIWNIPNFDAIILLKGYVDKKKRHLFEVALYCRQTLTKAGGVVVGSFLRWCYLRRVLITAAITRAALIVYTKVLSVFFASASRLTLVFISLALMALVNASKMVGCCAILKRVCAVKGVNCFGLLYFSLYFG